MTAGRGYLALAAVIFGNWRPLSGVSACFLFGFATALELTNRWNIPRTTATQSTLYFNNGRAHRVCRDIASRPRAWER